MKHIDGASGNPGERIKSNIKEGRSRGFGAVTVARLAPGETLSVLDGEATTIRIDHGEVWITEDGSFIDHILSAGQLYTFDRPGLALVAAQAASRVTVYAPRLGARPGRIATTHRVLYERPTWRTIVATVWPASMLQASRSPAL